MLSAMRSSPLRRSAATFAICLVAVAATACGGSSATKKDVIARGNAICSEAVRAVRALAPPPQGNTATALSAYLQRLLPIVDQEVSRLRKLPRARPDEALLHRYIDSITEAGTTYKQLAAAARRNDIASVAKYLGALRASPAQSLAQRYGMTQCAAATGTASP
jgi:hypothetical protein